MGVQAIRVLGIGGTTRQNSSSERALRVAAAAAAEAGVSVELITSEDLVLPLYDPEKSDRSDRAAALVAALRDADALLVSSPGYHGTVSGMVKNALDYVEDLRDDDRSYLSGLPVGCIAVAHGWQASVATLQTLRTCAHALRGWPTPMGAALNASLPGLFDRATGACMDESARFQLETVGRQVVDFATARLGAEGALDPAHV
ncbi:NADPH-dependent FMN reductase [Streptomyces mirabilis]|uniref:NADPH-dependent FMN reductase n=1 Tax=Streptomyces mirabilis TaxID=68239 RepID=UPI0033B95169